MGWQLNQHTVPVTDGDCVCRSCGSGKLEEFDAKLRLRLPQGNGQLSNSITLTPKLLVCLECRSAQFCLSPTELQRLKAGFEERGRAAGAS